VGAAEKTQADRDKRTKEIDDTISKNNVERAAKESLRRGLENELEDALEELERSKQIHKISNNLQVVLVGFGKLITTSEPNGADITTLSTKYKVKDYGKTNSAGIENALIDDSSTITDIAVNSAGATVKEILDYANGFLDKLKTINMSPSTANSYKETALNHYNDRK